MNKYLEYTI